MNTLQYLYEIKNIINNKRYIGRTCNPDTRKKRHFRELEKNKHHCIFLQRAFNKYGKDNFIIEEIDNANSQDELNNKEQYWIQYYNSVLPNGYNCDLGGSGLSGVESHNGLIKD